MTDEEVALGQNIVILREARGLTQKQLAIRAGIQPHTLCAIERGRHVPQRGTLQRLAEILLPGGPKDDEPITHDPSTAQVES